MPFERPWARRDEFGLARYVHEAARHLLAYRGSSYDAAQSPEDRVSLIRDLFDALRGANIAYTEEPYAPEDGVQVIRTPTEIIRGGEGTCLDLVLCLAGIAYGYDLLPLIVVLEGHAVLALGTTAGRREWRTSARHYLAFRDAPVHELEVVRALVDGGDFIALECTGFAYSKSLAMGTMPESQGRSGGLMSFERAVEAGREQLEARGFRFAVNVAVARRDWRIEAEPFAGMFDAGERGLTEHLHAEGAASIAEATRHFVGRRYILEEIERALADAAFRAGYVIVRGEPGIGKTALASWIVRTHGHPHHFNRAGGRARTARDFLTNICAQLIVRYALPYSSLPAHAGEKPAFLMQLLAEAAEANERVVVVLDALDESEVTREDAGANRLFLPVALPERVYFVVTTREEDDARLFVTSRRDVQIREDDPRNVDDIKEYVRRFAEREHEVVALRLREWGVDLETFAATIAAASEGNFMYVVYVVQDIRDGKISRETLGDIRALPVGLRAYYQRHWRLMESALGDSFHQWHELVIGVLAVVQEPVGVEQIAQWTQLPPRVVASVVRAWRQFLNETARGAEPSFRLYHSSFREFLRSELYLPKLHDMIAARILAKQPAD